MFSLWLSSQTRGGPFPILHIVWDTTLIPLTAQEVHDKLLHGTPPIQTHAAGSGNTFYLRPAALRPHEYKVIAERLSQVFVTAAAQAKERAYSSSGSGSGGSSSSDTSDSAAGYRFWGRALTGEWTVHMKYSRGSSQVGAHITPPIPNLQSNYYSCSTSNIRSGTMLVLYIARSSTAIPH